MRGCVAATPHCPSASFSTSPPLNRVLNRRSERLFVALGQEPELAAAAARYMALVAPALIAIGIGEACKRSLMCQGVVRPTTAVAAVTACLSPAFNWLLIVRLGLGLDGAALAVVALQLTSTLLMVAYTIARNIRQGCGKAVGEPTGRLCSRGSAWLHAP